MDIKLITAGMIMAAMLASVCQSQLASAQIAEQGKEGPMRYQEMVKLWTPEEKLIHSTFKSKTRAKGFRIIWGMALRHAKVGNKWLPLKEQYLRERLGYKNRACVHDLIEALVEAEVLVPHPGNGHGLDYNLYRWAIPTNIWSVPAMPDGQEPEWDEIPEPEPF